MGSKNPVRFGRWPKSYRVFSKTVLAGAAGMDQVKHHGLLILNQCRVSIGDDLVSQAQEGRDDLKACFVRAILLSQYLEQLSGALSGKVYAGAHHLHT